MDLRAVIWEDAMAPALVLALIAGLPDDSRLAASTRDEPFGWGTDRHLQVTQLDLLKQVLIAAGRWKPGKAPKFEPFPRPGRAAAGKPKSLSSLLGRTG